MKHCPHCGCDLAPPKPGKPRSVPQHRRFHALIRAALNHWPESHAFQPQTEEHLRRYLQCKAGYHTVDTIDTADMASEHIGPALVAALHGKTHPFVKAAGTKIYIFVSKSISFDELPHLAACALFDAVAEVIEAETGQRVDEMLRYTPRTTKTERIPGIAI